MRLPGYDRWLDPPDDDPPEDEEPCEWCGKRTRCRCEQLIDQYDEERRDHVRR